MGEFLASGIPVIGNRGVGDMADLIEHYKVGVVVEDGSEAEMRKGLDSLMLLLKDPEIATRCRYSAADYFSVVKGVEKYRCNRSS
jgi:glycosyltransferase involved in cell wall biosynthesis